MVAPTPRRAAAYRYSDVNVPQLQPNIYRRKKCSFALNGLIVMKLLRGELPPLVSYPGGREPLVFYLQAAAVWLLGRTPGALRLPMALASSALVLGAGLLARELWGRKAGWLSALLCATTFWPVYLGRLGTRPVLFPMLAAFGLWALARGWRSRRLRHWIGGGVLLGATHYTYAPNLFVLPALLLIGAGVLVLRPAVWRARWRELLRAGWLAAGAGMAHRCKAPAASCAHLRMGSRCVPAPGPSGSGPLLAGSPRPPGSS